MPEAAMTSGQPENDSVRPSLSLDDAAKLDFDDPGDPEDTNEEEQSAQSEPETDETDEGQESDDELEASPEDDNETETEESGEEDEASTPEPGDDVSVTLNGQKLTLNELKRGYLREGDYTRKTQAVSQKEKSLDALSSRVTKSVDAIADFLAKQIPDAPDPSLAMTNPGEYVQRKAMYEAAMQQVSAILSSADDVKSVVKTLSDEQRRELLAEENAKLAEAFPQTATQEGRAKFFTNASTAAKELGYSDDEIKEVSDSRMFKLAHYAALGLAAEKAKAKVAKKVADVPPVAPQKRQQAPGTAKVRANQEAMKRLGRTGSMADAMAIDFD